MEAAPGSAPSQQAGQAVKAALSLPPHVDPLQYMRNIVPMSRSPLDLDSIYKSNHVLIKLRFQKSSRDAATLSNAIG